MPLLVESANGVGEDNTFTGLVIRKPGSEQQQHRLNK